MILASSSSIYDGRSEEPVHEDEPPAPGSFYGRTKLAAELICRRSRLDTVVLRYFTVYGERQRPDMAFAAFIAAALDGGSAPLIADGEHLRHFTFVGDVVDATVRAHDRAPAGATYNVAGPEPVTVISALRLLERSLGKSVPVQRLPAPRRRGAAYPRRHLASPPRPRLAAARDTGRWPVSSSRP